MKLIPAVLLVALVGYPFVTATAQTSDKPSLVNITLNSARSLIGEVRSDNAAAIVVFDLSTGNEETIKKTDVKTKVAASDSQAIARIGLPRFMAWRIGSELNGPVTGKIAEVTSAVIYVTRGGKDGIEVGNSLTVFRDDGDLKDPDDGKVIGKKRSKLAKLEVLEVTDSYCKAKKLGDLEVELKVGDLVEQDGVNQAVAVGSPGTELEFAL